MNFGSGTRWRLPTFTEGNCLRSQDSVTIPPPSGSRRRLHSLNVRRRILPLPLFTGAGIPYFDLEISPPVDRGSKDTFI